MSMLLSRSLPLSRLSSALSHPPPHHAPLSSAASAALATPHHPFTQFLVNTKPVALTQDWLCQLHDLLGTSWWGTILVVAVGFRAAVFIPAQVTSQKAATYTHCEVSQFAPSISASIGGFIPQKYIWQTCIALHTAPRFLFGYLSTRQLSRRLGADGPAPHASRAVVAALRVTLLLQWLEILALLGLSIVSSLENFPIHKTCFATFMLCSWLFMSVNVWLLTRPESKTRHQYERRAVRLKTSLLKFTLVSVAAMLYCYWRHNEYCEPYVYSFFCMLEYSVVVTNMCYHLAGGYFDFYASELIVTESQLGLGSGYLPLFASQEQGSSKPMDM